MLAGSPYRKTYNASSFADQAINFVCQDYAGGHQGDPEWEDRPNFFNHNCPNVRIFLECQTRADCTAVQGMRAQVV